MSSQRILLLLGTKEKKALDWRNEEKYKNLGNALENAGYTVETATWTRDNLEELENQFQDCGALLVWVNPVDRDIDHGEFENLLRKVRDSGTYVSGDPDVIEKIGTKAILVLMSGTSWINGASLHTSTATLKGIQTRLDAGQIRVTKQFRGNGGIEIFKLEKLPDRSYLATEANTLQQIRREDFSDIVQVIGAKTNQKNPTIEVPWNKNLINGIVRCYFCGDRVAGFGYQEINALYPLELPKEITKQRFYLTENCGLFQGLRKEAEEVFVKQLITRTKLNPKDLPLIWDADFFIIDISKNKYELCEINASSVSPFPPSAIAHMVREVKRRLS